MLHSTSLSDLTDDVVMNYDQYFFRQVPNTVTISSKLNFKSGRAAQDERTLIHESDLLQAREENKKKQNKVQKLEKSLKKLRNLQPC